MIEDQLNSLKTVYLADSLVNWKPAHRLRRLFRDRGIECLPEKWDVETDPKDGWKISRTKSFSEVEAEVRSCQAVVCAYPHWTEGGKRNWFELWTAKEAELPIVVARYASRTEQPELKKLLSSAAWINSKLDPEAGIRNVVGAIELFLRPPAIFIAVPDPPQVVLAESRSYWRNLMDAVSTDPTILRAVAPRRFEEIVASLLEQDGYTVELTDETRDGGVDIFAYREDNGFRPLFLVECKRYAEKRPVSVEIVRNLYGVQQMKRAAGSMIVTTSRFTQDAIREAEPLSHQVSLRDFNFVSAWVRKHQSIPSP